MSDKWKELPDILTLTQVSKLLNVHPNTLRNWDRSGELTAMRIGIKKLRRYQKSEIIKFINDCKERKYEQEI